MVAPRTPLSSYILAMDHCMTVQESGGVGTWILGAIMAVIAPRLIRIGHRRTLRVGDAEDQAGEHAGLGRIHSGCSRSYFSWAGHRLVVLSRTCGEGLHPLWHFAIYDEGICLGGGCSPVWSEADACAAAVAVLESLDRGAGS
jgi:hypothetical protein